MSPSYDPDPFRYLRDQAYGRITIGGRSGDPAWSLNSDFWWNAQTLEGNMPLPTDTHAQTIYAPNAASVYTSFGANVLTRTGLGLQTAPTRTNGIRNTTGQGLAVGVIGSGGVVPTNWNESFTPSAVTRSVVGTQVINGITHVGLSFVGTPSGTIIEVLSLEATNVIAATNGQVWASSVFLQADNLTNTAIDFRVLEETAAGAFIKTHTVATAPPTTSARFNNNNTLDGGGTVGNVTLALGIAFTSGQAVNFTLWIGCGQAELGAFVGAPIQTSGSAITVNGNQQVISGLGTQLVTGVAGLVQFNQIALQSPGNKKILTFSDGTGSNLLTMASSSGTMIIQTASGGVFDGNVSGGAEAVGLQTWAFAYAANYLNFRKVGASANTADTSLTMPVGLDRLGIGGLGFSSGENTYQFTSKLDLDFLTPSDDPATKFAEWYAKAQLAAAA